MVNDLIRDATFGQWVHYLSGGRLFPYPEERPGYVIPAHLIRPAKSRPVSFAIQPPPKALHTGKALEAVHEDGEAPKSPTFPNRRSSVIQTRRQSTFTIVGVDGRSPSRLDEEDEFDGRTSPTGGRLSGLFDRRASVYSNAPGFVMVDYDLVGWDGPEDPANPKNWSSAKKAFVAACISYLTFAMYIGSAIWTASIPGVMEEFDAGLVRATLGLTLYVFGYAVGPIFLAPLQEIPAIGRTPVYIYTLAIFVGCQAPIALSNNLNVILALRFLTGFFGGTALATGGASMADMYTIQQLPYVMGVWSLFAVAGPVSGPIAGAFAAEVKGWRWPMWEMLWLGGFSLIVLAVVLPETYGPAILLKRAHRLRKLTGRNDLHTAVELAQASQTAGAILFEACVRPFVLMAEPVLLFANIYLGFVYSLFFLWFESFPIVFSGIYHFDLGKSSLPFAAYYVTGIITYIFYVCYQTYHIKPRYIAAAKAGKTVPPEIRLEIGLMASIFIPTSMLIFGYTAREDIHWIVPVIGASLYLPGIFLTFLSILIYIASSYHNYAASALAGNDFFRSTMASVFPLFGTIYFQNLGLGTGGAVLAGIAVALIAVYYTLWRFAGRLRARSKYAGSH
ncbi:major facilitator superfamily domain-containing protein [Mycena alexandri]|uniref:Major facilitator superfamily domain-containing protein n=1 Tax=Mycena alexandri TaxID=1745969 RepID=A0AAD6TBE8_9AGAR|nr:major facilitator superfamily domain-containing protein [Mycena alexandri]